MLLKNYIVYMACELSPDGSIETFDTEQSAKKRCNEFLDMLYGYPMCGESFYLTREDFLKYGLNKSFWLNEVKLWIVHHEKS